MADLDQLFAYDRDTQHEGTQHLAVNNTFIRRWITLLALRITARFYKADGICVPISRNLIVKRGPFVHLTEAATMEFVAANTSIPVPRVHCAFIHNNMAYIVMERVRGRSIAGAWKSLSEADMKSILTQLRTMLQELRALPPPPGAGVQSCVGGSLMDSRIPHARPRFGPFSTIQAFHKWLRKDYRLEDHPPIKDDGDRKGVELMIAMQDGPWPPPVFTHGDLNPSNILVRGDRVVGIIDWEFAGWYPHYWEYTSVWYGNRLRHEWQGMIPDFLDPHPAELQMEITRQRGWGDF
ncbi:kinase-like protein [Sodiomyces alkalinus F11]|uniref:Kinase-like protein n=1 Tax=Sodiomyces alkalinus (strain CBS 110278 / VKM F-3762 / F11) TaxID=1314773 RepID=A0A3N2Q601_SODAK|nr:kinase-like protein [Sodiomyces alkalinus F11]ROT42209.1 kinase-like protein [Sodiomyces alkalinus F11]